MKAIILAAGRGTRMKNLTDDRPKCLVEVGGKPLLEWQLTALREANVEDVGVVTGYRRELLSSWKLTEFHNPRWAETNMVSSLESAQEWLRAETCIVSYSDIFYKAPAVESLVDAPRAADIAVTYDPNWLDLWKMRFADPLVDAETFRLKTDNTLAEIGNRPTSVDEIQGQYMGLLRFAPSGWAEIARIRSGMTQAVRDRMHMTGTLQHVIQAGRVPILGVPYRGEWGEIDSPDDLRNYS